MTDSKPIVNLVSEVGHIMSNVVEKVRNRHFSYFLANHSYAELRICLGEKDENIQPTKKLINQQSENCASSLFGLDFRCFC